MFKITGCVSISAFAFLFRVPIGVRSFAIELKICATTEASKNYNSVIQKKNKKHDKLVLLAKSKLNSIGVLISNVLVDSDIIHDEPVSMNNALKDFYDMKEEIQNSNHKQKLKLYI